MVISEIFIKCYAKKFDCWNFRMDWISNCKAVECVFLVGGYHILSFTNVERKSVGLETVITGEGGWFVIFRIFKSILFLSIEFHCTFSISFIKYYHIMFIIIVYYYCIIIVCPSGHLFSYPFCFFHPHASLLTSFVCFFVLFDSCCSHARVFGKTLVHEFPISYSHTEWYLLFSLCEGNE